MLFQKEQPLNNHFYTKKTATSSSALQYYNIGIRAKTKKKISKYETESETGKLMQYNEQ